MRASGAHGSLVFTWLALGLCLSHCSSQIDEIGQDAYVSCEVASDCAGLNTHCAAYTQEPGQQFCAPFCEHDADCPAAPGFEARCNFAWCALSCSAGSCPHGMACASGQDLVDDRGERIGRLDVCVIAPQ
jgi:hypothetical protein